jgi:hypothetical protein
MGRVAGDGIVDGFAGAALPAANTHDMSSSVQAAARDAVSSRGIRQEIGRVWRIRGNTLGDTGFQPVQRAPEVQNLQ